MKQESAAVDGVTRQWSPLERWAIQTLGHLIAWSKEFQGNSPNVTMPDHLYTKRQVWNLFIYFHQLFTMLMCVPGTVLGPAI